MNQLCRHRLHKARTTHSPDFSLSEVRNAISELKEGRCIDPIGFVREIFTELVQSVVTMLNVIKKNVKFHLDGLKCISVHCINRKDHGKNQRTIEVFYCCYCLNNI